MKILTRLLPAQDIDALVGDIVEESRRRSRLWYWSQLAAVVLVAGWKDVCADKWLAVRATLTGLVALPVFFYPASMALYVMRVLADGGYYVGPFWLTLPRSALMVAPFFFNLIGFWLSGWVVTRFNREHGLAMVLPYLALVCGIPAVTLMVVLLDNEPRPGLITTHPALFASAIGAIVLLPVSVLLGAMFGTHREDELS